MFGLLHSCFLFYDISLKFESIFFYKINYKLEQTHIKQVWKRNFGEKLMKVRKSIAISLNVFFKKKKFEKLVFSSIFWGATSLDFTSVILCLLRFHCDKRKKIKEKAVFHDQIVCE